MVYHATLSLTYVQELLGNLSHVQHMFRGVAAGGGSSATSAAAANAAARMLGRSLARAAGRLRGLVADPSSVYLAPEGMHTLQEFGWAEVTTHDAAMAAQLGSTELQLLYGDKAVASYHRANPDDAWMQIGAVALHDAKAIPHASLPRASSPMSAASSGELPPVLSPATSVCTLRDGAVVPGPNAGWGVVSMEGRLSLEALAAQLSAAGQSVQAAAGLLQTWLDERKAVAATAAPPASLAAV
jgi:hypothetical protein